MLSDLIRERALGLLVTYRRETTGSLGDVVNVGDVICWLNRRVTEQGLSMTTAKCYRRWLAAYFEDEDHAQSSMMRNWAPPGSHEDVIEKDILDAEVLRSTLSLKSVKTNSRYFVSLDRPVYSLLMNQLLFIESNGKARYKNGPVTALMFTATMMTGLRPNEWPGARFLDSFTDPETMLTLGPVLEVYTMKQSNRREDNPLREKRYLLMDQWPSDQVETVKGFVAEVMHAGDDYAGLYNRVRMTINRAWNRILRERCADEGNDLLQMADDDGGHGISLYTARHVFAEEIRRSLSCTRFELAAMLGHSMLTNQVLYGPRDGHSDREFDFVLPRPWPGDAEDIQRWDHQVNPLRQRFAQGDLFGGPVSESELARENREGVSGFYNR